MEEKKLTITTRAKQTDSWFERVEKSSTNNIGLQDIRKRGREMERDFHLDESV